MGAIGAHGMRSVPEPGQQDFAILNPLNFNLALLAALQVEGRETLDLVFLGHDPA